MCEQIIVKKKKNSCLKKKLVKKIKDQKIFKIHFHSIKHIIIIIIILYCKVKTNTFKSFGINK